MSVPRTRQFNGTLLADVHFWNYQEREMLVYSLIDEATRFHVIYHYNRQELHVFCWLTIIDRTWLGGALSSWEQ